MIIMTTRDWVIPKEGELSEAFCYIKYLKDDNYAAHNAVKKVSPFLFSELRS